MRLGVYRHYKGGLYLVTAVARHTETLEPIVFYQSLYGDFGYWARPLIMFEGKQEYQGEIVDRFTFLNNPGENPPTPR